MKQLAHSMLVILIFAPLFGMFSACSQINNDYREGSASTGKSIRWRVPYTSDRDGDYEAYCYTLYMDGSSIEENISNSSTSNDLYPRLSPDGTKISFISNRDGHDEIYIIDADGNGPAQRITRDSKIDIPGAWSPDGSKIVFESYVSSTDTEIYVVDTDGSERMMNISKHTTRDRSPSWAPGSSRVVFISTRDSLTGELYTVDADGETIPERITNNSGYEYFPQWSPNGTKILFSKDNGIYMMDQNGNNEENLTSYRSMAVWSPDGSAIAFVANGSRGDLYIMNINDRSIRSVVTCYEMCNLVWSPDGNMIAFQGELNNIYMVEIDNSSGLIEIAKNKGHNFLY